jgi:hypothetical protein
MTQKDKKTEDQDYKVGPGKPPKEHQFRPGQSGNPSGPPVRRTQLWVYFTKYMGMTDGDLEKLDRTKLTQSQQTALKIIENAKNGLGCGSERLARYIVDREEGKAVERLIIDNENILTDEECNQIRDLLKDKC